MDTTNKEPAAMTQPTLYRVTIKRTGQTMMATLAQIAQIHDAPRTSIRFLVNGIKVNGGKLESAGYSLSTKWTGGKVLSVSHGLHCGRFSAEIHNAFAVKNDTDTQTDYFDRDRFDVPTTHPLFPAVVSAMRAYLESSASRHDKHAAKLAAGGKAARATAYTRYAESDRTSLAELNAFAGSAAKVAEAA